MILLIVPMHTRFTSLHFLELKDNCLRGPQEKYAQLTRLILPIMEQTIEIKCKFIFGHFLLFRLLKSRTARYQNPVDAKSGFSKSRIQTTLSFSFRKQNGSQKEKLNKHRNEATTNLSFFTFFFYTHQKPKQ
jgi:hypothetical protein